VTQSRAVKGVVLVPGYGATPRSDWFPWLSRSITEGFGIPTATIRMPTPKIPRLAKWIQAIKSQSGNIDQDTYFIAHSLGCITLLRFIETLPADTQIGGVILVSCFDEPLRLLPIVNSFTAVRPDYGGIVGRIGKALVISSTSDILVPMRLSEKVRDSLSAEYMQIPDAGHFSSFDGYTEFPEVFDAFKQMIS